MDSPMVHLASAKKRRSGEAAPLVGKFTVKSGIFFNRQRTIAADGFEIEQQ
jgi:hypothetical protein